MIDWKSKLTSRKFWLSVANFITMLVVAFRGSQETGTQIAALIMAGASVVAYVIGEGWADAAGASTIYYEDDEEEEEKPYTVNNDGLGNVQS